MWAVVVIYTKEQMYPVKKSPKRKAGCEGAQTLRDAFK